TVVVGLFLAAHGDSPFLYAVPQARFLNHPSAAFDYFNLAGDLVVDGLSNKSERIDVLQLGPRAELLLADLPYGHIGVAAQAPFLHVAVANVEVLEDFLETGEIVVSFFGRSDVWRCDDFDERHSTAIEVQIRIAI